MFRAFIGLKIERKILFGKIFKFKTHKKIEKIDAIISINLSISLKSLILFFIFFLELFIAL